MADHRFSDFHCYAYAQGKVGAVANEKIEGGKIIQHLATSQDGTLTESLKQQAIPSEDGGNPIGDGPVEQDTPDVSERILKACRQTLDIKP